jgi:imidazole glycerol-phosphate synthase subunit HisH
MLIVALIDYESGNLRSAEKALAHAAAEGATGHEIRVTGDPAVVAQADRIVLPGVGTFGDCIGALRAIPDMVDALEDAVLKRRLPFLGICVGMQLLADIGREFGEHKGLGWIGGEVIYLRPDDKSLKIPHMGWNELTIKHTHPLLEGIERGDHVYFVHSYAFRAHNDTDVVATTDYGGPVTAMIGRDNIAGTQFHPEKSQTVGLKLLSNFLVWKP